MVGPFLIYLACCLLVGYLARDRVIGFAGFFLLSFIFTPLVMFVVFILGMRRGAS
jgi:hypothetical protein